MTARNPQLGPHHASSVVDRNRQALDNAGVVCVSVTGRAGSGKSTLIAATIERLAARGLRAVTICGGDFTSGPTLDHPGRRPASTVYVCAGTERHLGARHVQAALGFLDLDDLDLVLVENRPAWNGAVADDVGERARVFVFAADVGGAQGTGDVDTDRSDAVVLTKCDLLWTVPFALTTLQQRIEQRLHGARLFRVAALEGYGIDAWTAWLGRLLAVPRLTPATLTDNLLRAERPS